MEQLLRAEQLVRGVDNFSTGSRANLEQIRQTLPDGAWDLFTFTQGDVGDSAVAAEACADVDYILHQTALGSVPRSVRDPVSSNTANVDAFLVLATNAKDSGAQRVVYASSSSVYGDIADSPKVEDRLGRPLSPYAVSKLTNELYADAFSTLYGMELVGLRYFNVFGPRQDQNGEYAAVIPRWAAALGSGECCTINGDGETSRDFCYVDNVVAANLLAATVTLPRRRPWIYNVACADSTSLNRLYRMIDEGVARRTGRPRSEPQHGSPRPGDVRQSVADISRARGELGYEPTIRLAEGLERTLDAMLHA